MIKVFIDGRTEVYGASFFQLYQKIWKEGDLKVFRDMEEKYNITGAFLNNNNQEIPRKVLIMFHRMPGWKAVYFDEDAVIFLKETPANKAWIAKFAVNWNKWDPKPMDLQKLGTRRIDPFPYTSRAYVLEILGFQGPALKEAALALKVDPDDALAYRITGRIYGQRKNYRKAFENYRLAAMLAPGDRPSRLGLAWSYEHMGNNRGALLQYQRLLADKPKDVKIAGKVEKLKKLLKI